MNSGKKNGFTLMELLVVIAVIAILAAMLLPALSKSKSRTQTIVCLNNLRQLSICWYLYAGDHHDLMVPNDNIAGGAPGPSWCQGTGILETNTTVIQSGLLFNYNRSTALYHCPADVSRVVSLSGARLSQLRNRSYNLSQSVNGEPTAWLATHIPNFNRFSQISGPDSSQCLVFIDENEDTMLDTAFWNADGELWQYQSMVGHALEPAWSRSQFVVCRQPCGALALGGAENCPNQSDAGHNRRPP